MKRGGKNQGCNRGTFLDGNGRRGNGGEGRGGKEKLCDEEVCERGKRRGKEEKEWEDGGRAKRVKWLEENGERAGRKKKGRHRRRRRGRRRRGEKENRSTGGGACKRKVGEERKEAGRGKNDGEAFQ